MNNKQTVLWSSLYVNKALSFYLLRVIFLFTQTLYQQKYSSLYIKYLSLTSLLIPPPQIRTDKQHTTQKQSTEPHGKEVENHLQTIHQDQAQTTGNLTTMIRWTLRYNKGCNSVCTGLLNQPETLAGV